jgi:UDP-2,3-diacylglucosamine pyrophosphatase LpxH
MAGRLLWLTDLHLEFLSRRQSAAFLSRLAAQKPDAALIGGDISTATRIVQDLKAIQATLQVPVYFVLGNHDFYHGRIEKVRGQIRALCSEIKNLHWLEDAGCVRLDDDLALVGHGCWGDGRAGDFWGSNLELNDFYRIEDFKGLHRAERLSLLNHLGEEAADYLGRFCREAADCCQRVFVLTHATPFWETCLHEGRPAPEGLPFFCCQRAGEVLRKVASEFPKVTFTVLSGHTHHHACRQILPNLKSWVLGAVYNEPGFELLEV